MADIAQLEEQIVSLSLLEAAALVKKLEERLGVSAAAAAPVVVAGGGNAAPNGPPGAGGPRGGGDMQQILSRAPAIQLSDLQKGEAVMLVSTQGASDVTAITLLAGVEPLLEAPASQDLLSNWSMGASGEGGGEQ